MYDFKSFRYVLYMLVYSIFFFLAPLWVYKLIVGTPVPIVGMVVYWLAAWHFAPKIHSWLIYNTPFRHVWTWARAKE